MSTTPAPTIHPSGLRAGRLMTALGNEVHKGLVHGWAERKQIVLELVMFVVLFLLFAAVLGQGEQIAAGAFEWTFDPQRTAWLFVGFGGFMFHYLQAQKLFWRLLGEIQTGTLDEVYLSPLPSWLLAAVGRAAANVVETAVVVAALYAGARLATPMALHWHPDALLALAGLVVAGVGYTLVIGGLTLRFKRLQVVNDGLHVLVMFAGGAMVPPADLPGWMAAIGRWMPITHPIEALRTTLVGGQGLGGFGDGGLVWVAATAVGWLAAGALAFHLGDTAARRQGRLTRY